MSDTYDNGTNIGNMTECPECRALERELREDRARIAELERERESVITALVRNLRELLSQWRETVRLYETEPEMKKAASGYRECIVELEQIIAGDLSAIEPINSETPAKGKGEP